MNTSDQSTEQVPAGRPSSADTLLRQSTLAGQVRSELKAATSTCIAGAVAKGYTLEELAASFIGEELRFRSLADGALPTLAEAVDLARACGYRLRISVEAMDEEVQTPPGELKTPFETTAEWMANHSLLKHIKEEEREDVLRHILSQYFGQLREKGYYLATRGA